MSGYVPNNFDSTNPTDAVIAETAQAEFRNMKAFFQGTLGRLISPPLIIVNSALGVQLVSIPVPAGALGTNRKLRTTMNGVFSNVLGSAQGFGLVPVFGSALFSETLPIPASTTSAFKFIIELFNIGATNSQGASTEYHLFGNGSNAGVSAGEVAGYPIGGITTAGALDTTLPQTFAINGNLSTASNSLAITFHSIVTEWF